MSSVFDEETPLLTSSSESSQDTLLRTNIKKQRTPLPWRQFSILLLLQITEPITSHVISPFLPQLIRDIGITDGKDSRVAYYVGLMHSLFFLTEACTIFHWSRLSDEVGRKPVLLMGLFGLSVSMWCFGLSKTFWTLVVSRCLNGALNGNIGVMKSMTIEITDSTNIAQAYGILPVTWSIGVTLGPLIGGSLANPTERFPKIFGNSQFLKKYPYFLPCSVPATIAALSWLITLLFLKETMTPRVSLGQYLFGGTIKDHKPNPEGQAAEEVLHASPEQESINKQLPFRALLTRSILIAGGSYATLALVEMAHRAIMPVFYALPIETGGLGLDPPAIGIILALLGISQGIFQWIFFAPMHDWLGPKILFLVTVSLFIPAIVICPVINAVARVWGVGTFVWFLVGFQNLLIVFTGFAFGITFMYIGAAAPNKASIGATNGLAQIMVSLMRAVGPAAANSAFSLSIEKNIMGGHLAYWVMVGMVGLTLWVGFLLPRSL